MFRKFITQSFMNGHGFEREIQWMLRQLGFTAMTTGNYDRGVDIIAKAPTEGNPQFYIQCKYQNSTLSLDAIYQVYTGRAIHGNDAHPVVITNNNMTAEARRIANLLKIEIIAYPEWTDLANGYEQNQIIRPDQYGLMGILAGLSIKDINHAVKSSQKSILPNNSNPPQSVSEDNSNKENVKQQISNLYKEIEIQKEEVNNLDQKKFQKEQLILDLQKEAMMLTIDYG